MTTLETFTGATALADCQAYLADLPLGSIVTVTPIWNVTAAEINYVVSWF